MAELVKIDMVIKSLEKKLEKLREEKEKIENEQNEK